MWAVIALEDLPGAALFLDEQGRIADANTRAARIFRRRRRELRGHALAELIPEWETLDLTGLLAGRRVELTGLRSDGARIALRVSARAVETEGARTLVFLTNCERRRSLELQVRDATYGFHQIARAMPHMLWTCDPDGAVQYVSPRWVAYTGEPVQRHLGAGWLNHLHPEDRADAARRWRTAVERKTTFKTEFRVRRADGAYRWFDSTCLPVRNRANAIVRWMGSNVDVHDAYELRQALIEERDRFGKIAETAPGVIYAYRMRPNGEVSYPFASAGIRELYGLSAEELARDADAAMQFVHPDDVERLSASRVKSARELSPWRCEWRLLNPVKGEIWVEGRSAPTRESDGGTLWYGIMMDVTERKRAEEELRRSRARLAAALMASGIGTWILDARTGRLWRDERVMQMFDCERAEIEYRGAQTLQGCVHPDDWPQVLEAIAAVVEGDSDVFSVEFRNARRHAAAQWIAISGRVQRDADGRILTVTGACTDLTARKAAEEAQRQSQRIEALGTLAGGIAHDFNNILLAITGNTRLALAAASADSPPDSPLLCSLREIDSASSRAADLVHSILAFSRQSEHRREIMDLRPAVEEAVRLLRATLPAMIAIETEYHDAPAVLADATQIHQVIMNLVTNSAYAIGEGPGTVGVRLERVEFSGADGPAQQLGPGEYACITVSDTGQGMDRATLDRIFDPFFTTKPAGQGTGLGLSVVHGIVRGHQGAIVVSSEPNRGSVFRLHFPAAAQPAEAAARVQPAPAQGRGQRVMYIDDEESLVFLVSRLLERLGYRVDGYTNPHEALQAFRGDPRSFDVVVTDLSMPGMSGFQFAQELLEVSPDTPVLMTSGYVRAQDREAARRLGVREMILKPDTVEELGHALARVFAADRGPA
ncbi:MAG: PAS domain-containing protein [Steroidobacteraceae bacterium]|jgi:PAS domain S-box-containing protein|nr:PAS domain-containing protein [Steroidobacteraceae bacterium]